jgi:signal transduction histidine kinase
MVNTAVPQQWVWIGFGVSVGFVVLLFLVFDTSTLFTAPVLNTFSGLFLGLCIGGILLRREQRRTRQAQAEKALAHQLLAINQVLLTLDLDTLLQRCVDELMRVIPCRAVCLVLLNRWHREIEKVVTAGQMPAAALDELRRALVTETISASLERGPVVCNSPQEIRVHFPSLQLREGAHKSLLIVPIRRQQPIGYLLLTDKQQPTSFHDAEVRFLTAAAAQMAVAIENTRRLAHTQLAEAERRNLLRALISAHEQERKRVAEEWHERFGEKLFQVLRDFRACHELIVQRVPEGKERFEKLAGEIDAMATLVRSFTNELHPLVLDDFGFVAALREYVVGLREQEGLHVTIHADEPVSPLPTEANLGLFRILQEALLNIRKHAQANNVEIAFVQEHSGVSLLIKDDGQGFNPDHLPQGHYGLLYMRERAEACGGTLHVVSAQGQGTEVRVELPRNEKTIVQLTQRESSF